PGAPLAGDRAGEERLADLLAERPVDRLRHLGIALVVVDEAPREVPRAEPVEPRARGCGAEAADELHETLRGECDHRASAARVGRQWWEERHARPYTGVAQPGDPNGRTRS